jgi:ferredoxin--NADP+ reductase
VSDSIPLRVAVVGSGPAGFYLADALLKSAEPRAEVDLFERLPAPFGLLRSGVAPDHQRIKRAAQAFERTAQSPRFRFFGNVEIGRDVSIAELLCRYDQVAIATGSAVDRRLGIEGEELAGVHSALSFVGWYNGHPDFVAERFDLGVERAVVIGAGNVAMDVIRLLVRSPDELSETDITAEALEALRASRIREVVLVARRGPAEAAFAQSEIADIAELAGVRVELDAAPVTRALAEQELDATERRLLEYLAELAGAPARPAERRVRLVFLSSPRRFLADDGRVAGLEVEDNELVFDTEGHARAQGTGRLGRIEAGLCLRAIGFSGLALEGLPFDERRGIVPNDAGRVLGANGDPLTGLYVTGWIKRGPRGLIGANKGCASETAKVMLEDARGPRSRAAPRIDELFRSRGVRSVSFSEWQRLDALEREAGQKRGKVREKFTTIEAMLAALDALPEVELQRS